MIFETQIPQPPLDEYLEPFIYFKHFKPDHSIERVVPDGGIYLIFELDGFTRHTYDTETGEPNNTFTKVWISGMHKNYISISAHQDSSMLVVQFKAGGAKPFLPFPTCDLNNKVVPAEEVFGNAILDLQSNLVSAESHLEKFNLIQKYFLKIGNFESTSADKMVAEMCDVIKQNSHAKLKEIVAKSEYSQKQAIHLFKQKVGLNPKSYQRIIRFNEILPQIMEKKSIAWNTICSDCGYYDQSHFIKEFKQFSGYNPKEFLNEHSDFETTNFFPLD